MTTPPPAPAPQTFRSPVNPATTRINSPWGRVRTLNIRGTTTTRPHRGVDIVPSNGGQQTISAAQAGTVVYRGVNSNFGNAVIIYHGVNTAGKHIYTLYGHLASFDAGVTMNGTVAAGASLGIMGTTGRSSGVHLHYEVLESDTPLTQPGRTPAGAPRSALPASGTGALGFQTGQYSVNPEDPDPNSTTDQPYLRRGDAPAAQGGAQPSGMGGVELPPDAMAIWQEAAAQGSTPSAFASELNRYFGASLASYLFKGSPVAQVFGTALFQTVGQNVLQAFAQGGISVDVSVTLDDGWPLSRKNNILSNFGQEFASALQNAAIGSFSTFLAMQLGNSLGIRGFGGELIQTGASTVLQQVMTNAVTGQPVFAGLNAKGLFGSVGTDGVSVGGMLPAAFGAFFGKKLGGMILPPTNTVGAVLSSVGSGIGVWALTKGATQLGIGSFAASLGKTFGAFANIAVPFVGSLVGFLVGSLIGRLFGRRKPRVPTASAETALNIQSGWWELGAVTTANGGNRQFVLDMATSARDSINGVTALIVGGADLAQVSNVFSVRHRYGHTGNTVFYDERVGNSWVRRYTGSDATEAVDRGALAGIRSTRIMGGDIIGKRAVYLSTATSLAQLYGDLVVAADYQKYLAERETINQMIQIQPDSQFAASWYVTLARAGELGLNEYQVSDFYGGLQGFANSFGFDGAVADHFDRYDYESLTVSIEGTSLRIAATDGTAPFPTLTFTNNIADPAIAARSALIPNFQSRIGYTAWTGQATEGNDIWVAAASGQGVVMDDTGWREEWWWNEWDWSWEVNYVPVSGGDDIFVGSAHADQLYGQTGFDWLDAGEGFDLVDGGAQDDVILGRGGNDRLIGGAGNDYIHGGNDNDYFFDAAQNWGLYGGDGNDTLIGGAGMDSLYGENGDDLFIVDPDGGGVWDVYEGQAGLDTISYERFNHGVWIDFATLGGWSWAPQAKLIYGDYITNIENVTGSHFNDVIFGDAGWNVIKGLIGNDELYGRDGDDVLDGGFGGDRLDGGLGVDTASYANSLSGVQVNLATGVAQGGDAVGDSFVSIENLRGSRLGDQLAGDAGSNVLEGLRGEDTFLWSSGWDTVNGGEDFDTFDASAAPGAVTIWSGLWAQVAGDGSWTSLTSIEGFVGSAHGDALYGAAADERFEGRGGNDYLAGGDGSDIYVFGIGDGWDTVDETNAAANGISLRSGLNWRDVSIQGAGGNGALTVQMRATGEAISVNTNWSYGQNGQHNHRIKTLDIAGLSTIDIDLIDWQPWAESDAGTTVFGANNRADIIFAYGGDDYIATSQPGFTEWRNHIVYAGDGADTVISGSGDDQFIFERGNGADWLNDAGGIDTIVMGASVRADDVIFEVVVTGSDGLGGQMADLIIGLRDPNNPNLPASQVADRIRIAGGGTIFQDLYWGGTHSNSIEHVRVEGQELDLSQASLNFVTSYYWGYYGWGGGGGGGGGGFIPPLALDLDGDGIELRSVEGSRISTVAADGSLWRLGWIGADDGFLVLDRNGDGAIDRLSELTFTQDLEGAKTDLEGLAAFDSNKDGRFDAADARWGEFRVWQDRNQDGLGVGRELMSLEEAGVRSIALRGAPTGFTRRDTNDNLLHATTVIEWTDPNRAGLGYDVSLAAFQVRSDTAAPADRREKASVLDARLHGIQALTAAEVAAGRDAIARRNARAETSGEGLLGRVETFIDQARRGADGLLVVDDAARLHAENLRTANAATLDRRQDRFAGDAWSLQTTQPVARDQRGDTVIDRAQARPENAAVLAAVRRGFLERQRLNPDAGGMSAPTVERIAPPTAAELGRLTRLDRFRLIDDGMGRPVPTSPEMEMLRAAAQAEFAGAGALPPLRSSASASSGPDAPLTPLRTSGPGRWGEPLRGPAVDRSEDPAAGEAGDYRAIADRANALLLQSLAGFGASRGMIADRLGWQQQDGATPWMTVDAASPSIDRMIQI